MNVFFDGVRSYLLPKAQEASEFSIYSYGVDYDRPNDEERTRALCTMLGVEPVGHWHNLIHAKCVAWGVRRMPCPSKPDTPCTMELRWFEATNGKRFCAANYAIAWKGMGVERRSAILVEGFPETYWSFGEFPQPKENDFI